MLSASGLEVNKAVNSDSPWKVLKGNRSSSRRAVAKDSDRSSKFVCVNSRSYSMPISGTEKYQGNLLDCSSSGKLEHLPIKKRRFLFRQPSPPPKVRSPVKEGKPNFSKSQEDPMQSSVSCPVSCKSELGAISVEKDVQCTNPKKVNGILQGIEDFSGISILAAAACSSSLGREFGYAEDGSGIEEPSVHEGPVEVYTNSEAQSLSMGLVKEECVNTSDILTGGTSSCVTTALAGEFAATSNADCTSEKVEHIEKSIKEPIQEDGTPTVSSDLSSMRAEDVVGPQNLDSRDHRLHWDLNVVMDAWEQPFDYQNGDTSDHTVKASGKVVRCAANRSAEDHDLLTEPGSSMCEVEEKLLNCVPGKRIDQISELNRRSQADDYNHKNNSVSKCCLSFSSEHKSMPSSLGNVDFSFQPLLSKSVNEKPPVLKMFDIKKNADNEPTGESMNFDVAASLFTDQRSFSVPPVPDTKSAAITKNTSVSLIDNVQVRLVAHPTPDIENEVTLKSLMSGKPSDDRRKSLKDDENFAKVNTNLVVNNDAAVKKAQKENDHPPRSSSLHECPVTSGTKVNNDKYSLNGVEQAEDAVHVSIKEVKISSAEHLEEKFISDPAAELCPTHETEAAGKLQDDNDSQYEDGELRESWEEYDAVNVKTEHKGYEFDNSIYSVTVAQNHASESEHIRRIKNREAGKAGIISSAGPIANELGPESDRPIADDNNHGKDENVLKLIHSGDEKIKGPASSKTLESNQVSSATVIRVRDDCEGKARIYNLAPRLADSEGTRLHGRGLLSQIEGPVGRDMPFREEQAVIRSKLDGVAARWDQGSSYMNSSERVRYSVQSQPRIQVNGWDRSSDFRRGIKRHYSPSYHTQVKPDDEDDTLGKGDRDGTLTTASYLSHPLTNDESIGNVSTAGNFQPSHKLPGSDRLISRGRFVRYGRQLDHGAGRGRYNGPSTEDSFQSSLKYRGRPLSQRDRSFSPNESRGYSFAHQSHSISPSRSRTRSPDPRVSPRGRSAAGDCGGPYLRHKSRSPNFRSEARAPRMRSPPSHQRFGTDRVTGFRPFQKDHGSPPSSRWISSRKDELGQFNYKQRPIMDKSPNRIRRRGDRTDLLDSARNPKPDGCYRQNTGRFSEMDGAGRPHRLEENFENRRRQFGPIYTTRRGYEDGIAKRLQHSDDGFMSTNRDVPEFHGRGNREIDNRNGDIPRRFRRDATFMYEREGRLSSNSKQFGFGGIDSAGNLKSGEPYSRSINPGRFNEMGGGGRGHRYVDRHDERRRPFSAVYIPRRGEMEGLGRRLSHDVNDSLPVTQSSCNDDTTDSHSRNPRGTDGRVDDLPTGQREEQQLDLPGQEKELDETSKSTDVEVPAET